MKELLVRSLVKVQEPIDCSDLSLYIALNLSENQMVDVAEFVYKTFVEEFKDDFILDAFTDRRSNVAASKLFTEFLKGINKCGYADIGYNGMVKSDVIKNKKAYNLWLESLNFQGSKLSNGVAVDYHHTLNELRGTSSGNSGKEYFYNLFQGILNVEKIKYYTYPEWGDFAFTFSCGECGTTRNLCQGYIEFSVSSYVLGENTDAMANKLKEIALEFCSIFNNCNAYISVGTRFGQYLSPKMNYFVDYDEGIILEENKMFDCETWLNYKFIHGVEWFNILGQQITEKIEDIDVLKTIEGFCVEELNHDIVSIESKQFIHEFESRTTIPIYNCLKNCIRPGYYSLPISDVRKYWEDVWFNDDEYVVKDSNVHFRRGKFDFFTRKYL